MLLVSLGKRLRKFDERVNDSSAVKAAVQGCEGPLADLEEFVKARTKTRPGGELSGPAKSFSELKYALVEPYNTLCLALAWLSSPDGDRRVVPIPPWKSEFDEFSKYISGVTNAILPPAPTALDTRAKITVCERELRAIDKRNPKSTYYVVCPGAVLLGGSQQKLRLNSLRFACCCRNRQDSHDGQLQYDGDESLLIEEVGPEKETSWQIVLYKQAARAIVSVRITGIEPIYIGRIQELGRALAAQFVERKERKDAIGNVTPSPGKSLLARPLPDSIHVQAAKCDPGFLPRRGSLPFSICLETPNGIISLPWTPEYLQMFHYTAAARSTTGPESSLEPSDSLARPDSANSEPTPASTPWFLPKDHAEMVISKKASTQMGADDTYLVSFSKDSHIIHRENKRGPLWVTVSGVEAIENGQPFSCLKVEFGFDKMKDAENFTSYLEAMRQRLQTWCSGPCFDDYPIYTQISEATGDDEVASGVNISIVSTTPDLGHEANLRAIVTRPGSPGVVCISPDRNKRDLWKQFSESSHQFHIWLLDYNASKTPFLCQTNWDKLTWRGRGDKQKKINSGGTQSQRDAERSAENWFDEVDIVRKAMETSAAVKGPYNPVKVCVIDTGFSPGDRNARSIKEYRDFVNPDAKAMQDNTMHGTLSADIILSVFDECELYVARVFETNDSDEETGQKLMAEAIDWAIEPSRDVDIISVSAGFARHSSRLQDSVARASGKSKLVFAAASNWGNTDPVAFPARHDLYAICVFATNTLDQPSGFNPEVRPDAHNFALLGEGFSHPTVAGRREAGTSMATACAAGLAALILDFTRHADNRDIVRVADVGKMLGMVAVFKSISKRAGKYKCVAPKKLLPAEHKGLKEEEKRAYVKDSISRAMENAN